MCIIGQSLTYLIFVSAGCSIVAHPDWQHRPAAHCTMLSWLPIWASSSALTCIPCSLWPHHLREVNTWASCIKLEGMQVLRSRVTGLALGLHQVSSLLRVAFVDLLRLSKDCSAAFQASDMWVEVQDQWPKRLLLKGPPSRCFFVRHWCEIGLLLCCDREWPALCRTLQGHLREHPATLSAKLTSWPVRRGVSSTSLKGQGVL